MGKIRIKTLGDEEQEKEQKKKQQQRAEAKKVEATKKDAEEKTDEAVKETAAPAEEETPKEDKRAKKKEKFAGKKTQKHSTKYLSVSEVIDRNKKYKLAEAVAILPKLQRAKFDKTVELHINTIDKGISGNVTLPHGTGKATRVVIANQSEDAKAVEDLVKKIEGGQIEFDILIATPDTMPKLAKVARILGPKGLMPNPKNGTVTPKPQEIAKKFEGGQMNFKTEAKFPLLHMPVGKVSFGDKKLEENVKAAIQAISTKNIKTVTIKSTMSPGIKLDIATL
jgi:large subunit ribosomal protein L1